MSTKCSHTHTHQIGDNWGFTGSVAVYPYTDEDRRAHGAITIMVECDSCGARRKENHNQGFVEVGTWGPSRDTRRQEAERLQRAIPRPPQALSLTCGDGRKIRVSIDKDGMILLSGDAYTNEDERTIIAALPDKWLHAAQSFRSALLRAEDAASEV